MLQLRELGLGAFGTVGRLAHGFRLFIEEGRFIEDDLTFGHGSLTFAGAYFALSSLLEWDVRTPPRVARQDFERPL